MRFTQIERPTEEHQRIIIALITARAKEGATVSEIKKDFADFCSDYVAAMSTDDFEMTKDYLLCIKQVYYRKCKDGCYLWYVRSSNSQHINVMVREQKPARSAAAVNNNKRPYQKSTDCNWRQPPSAMVHRRFHSSENNCFFADNNRFQLKQYMSEPGLDRNSLWNGSGGGDRRRYNNNYCQRPNQQEQQQQQRKPARFYDYDLVGDDFLMSMAYSELNASIDRSKKVRRSGLCVSGQTIGDAVRRIDALAPLGQISPKCIVNLGSMDLLHGHEMIDMKNDFEQLLATFDRHGIEPIVTTLAPLANKAHCAQIQRRWLMFNRYLLKCCSPNVIDITPCFLSNNKSILFDCYQPCAKYMTGTSEPQTHWNRLGRQRMLKKLKVEVFENCYSSDQSISR